MPGWRYSGVGSAGGFRFRRVGGELGASLAFRHAEQVADGDRDWAAELDRHALAPGAADGRRRLADRLGVTVRSLEGLAVAWRPPRRAGEVGAWLVPMRGLGGRITGLSQRLDREHDNKRRVPGSRAGLFYVPGAWSQGDGPVHVVEGESDTAALDGLGLAVIGRPSAMVGAGVLEQLVELLARVGERGVVVVAERDAGTGEQAARRAAADLGARLGRPVSVVFPPDGAKDSRAWVTATAGTLEERRVAWLRHVQGTAEVVAAADTGAARVPVVRREELEPARPRIGVDTYRGELRTRLAEWASDRQAGRGRIAICGGPAGTGKSRAIDELVLGEFDRAVVVMPSHANLAERQRDLRALGVDAVAMPRLDEHSCQSFTEQQAVQLRGERGAVSAERVQQMGLPVVQLACSGCPLNPRRPAPDNGLGFLVESGWTVREAEGAGGGNCEYWKRHAEASAARVVLVTAERWRRSSERLVGPDDGRRVLVVIDEQAADAVRPRAVVSRWQLEMLSEALGEVHDRLAVEESRESRRSVDAEQSLRRRRKLERLAAELAAVDRLAVVVLRLLAALRDQSEAGEIGARVVDPGDVVAAGGELADGADDRRQRRLRAMWSVGDVPEATSGAWAGLGRAMLRCSRGHIDGGVLEVVRRIADGRVDGLALLVEQLDGGEGSRAARPRIREELLVSWGVPVPGHADVLLVDGTVDEASVRPFAGGRPVDRVDPPAAVRRLSATWQYPAEVTMGTSAETVAGVLERVLAAVPTAQRVGVILHKRHRLELFDRGGLPEALRRRVARVSHFGCGDDRASNSWQDECDLLVVVGTPRPGAGDVAAELLRRGEVEALEAGSSWGTVVWTGTVAAGGSGELRAGRLVDVAGRGYGSDAWASAAASITRAGLVQAVERARTVLPQGGGGVPAVVVSTESLGLEVRAELPRMLSAGARRVVDVLEVGRRHARLGWSGLRRVSLSAASAADGGSAPYMGSDIGVAAAAGMAAADVAAELVARSRDADGGVLPERTVRAWIAEAVEWGAVRRVGDRLELVDEVPGGPGPGEPRVERRSWPAACAPAGRALPDQGVVGRQRAPPLAAGP